TMTFEGGAKMMVGEEEVPSGGLRCPAGVVGRAGEGG
ncbi:hypothetical protein ACJX0J_041684, partial [Zea mays]